MMEQTDLQYVIGLDFGSDSVRAVLVDVENGQEKSAAVAHYPRWMKGLYCQASESQFRQHPKDYIESMTTAIKEALQHGPGGCADKVIGIGVDTTGSTPAPIDENGHILALLPQFEHNPNAMFVLWKDHTSITMAEKINQLAHCGQFPDYTQFIGGLYSSEWYWAKAAWVSEQDDEVAKAAYSWVELMDWLPALLSNNTSPHTIKRGICAAGHKALWHDSWGGLPSQPFLSAISPTLDGMRERYSKVVYTADQQAGILSNEWAEKLGLKAGIAIAIGEFDCHMGAVGAGAREHDLVKVIGTSTCDILMIEKEVIGDKTISGICGQVEGSALPDLVALEAGQSAFGDMYAWYQRLLAWPLNAWSKIHPEAAQEMNNISHAILPMLTDAIIAQEESNDQYDYYANKRSAQALDWLNGRRTPNANQRLSGSISNLNLGSDAPEVFHALIESTAFGAKAIADSMISQGMAVERVIAIGGISKKNSQIMQICSDVMGCDIAVVESEQCCALGAAIFAAVAAGRYASTKEAQLKMASSISHVYHPRASHQHYYQKRFADYQQLGEMMESFIMGRVSHNSLSHDSLSHNSEEK